MFTVDFLNFLKSTKIPAELSTNQSNYEATTQVFLHILAFFFFFLKKINFVYKA